LTIPRSISTVPFDEKGHLFFLYPTLESLRTNNIMMRLVTGLLALTSVSASAQAPDPMTVREPVVQVYGARTLGAKGLFGVHTWVAVKL
jgi:hypothetical protein